MTKLNVKDKLQDETLDLSLCDLEEVPVRDIVSKHSAFSGLNLLLKQTSNNTFFDFCI